MILREEVNETGESHIVCNEKVFNNLLATHRRIEAMYRAKPHDLNFWNDDCTINFESMGKLINLQKNWTIKDSNS